jgi:hypothetical protein
MTKKLFKRIWLLLWRLCLLLPIFFVKADENLSVIDKVTDEEANHINQRIKFISATPWKVRINIHNAHEDLSFSERWAGWILEIDDIMNYMVQIIQFLSQLGLVVWTIFIMYAGYKYMFSAFGKGGVSSKIIVNAIVWVLIIIFSYAIMRILTSVIWLT